MSPSKDLALSVLVNGREITQVPVDRATDVAGLPPRIAELQYTAFALEPAEPGTEYRLRIGDFGLEAPPGSAPLVKVRCRACGALSDEDAKFCDQCGKPL